MYVPNHFAMSADQVGELLTGIGAADLVTAHESGLAATFLPFHYDAEIGEHGSLITHVVRNNSQAVEPVLGEAMVIVHGAEHYVSPRWLPSLAEHGQVVPTWNYVTVHAYGQLIVHDDAAWTADAVRRLTAAHESEYSVADVPADYLERMLRAIVGIEIRLSRVEAKAKMSQNKRPEDDRGIVEGLRGAPSGDAGAVLTATWMAAHSVPAADRRAALLDQVARARPHTPRS
ncbi:MAG: FMN-binding negative transcriptional regulator [Candidatus Nanopelagicales bacterium]